MTQQPTGAQQRALGTYDLVTSEAVVLDLPPATVGIRLVSSLIDLVVEGLVYATVLLLGLVVVAGGDLAQLATVNVVALVLGLVVTPTLQETLFHGKTLGKLVIGLRTVREDAGPISFRHALTRSLIGVVEGVFLGFVPALVSELVSARSQRIGDHAAGTYVVRDRFRLQLHAPLPMPPELEAWARSADVAALPDGLALAVRQFLGRAGGLNPTSRVRLGDELCRELLRYAAPAPPPGTHPEAVLAAVLATRRDRDLARLGRDAALRERLGVDD